MNNTRFATTIHILTLLARYKEERVSSDLIAKSININPVMVRRELGILQKAGWVVSSKGKEGGYRLNCGEDEISMASIYQLVKNSSVLGKKNNCSKSNCPVGKKINKNLEALFEATDNTVYKLLENTTLKNFAEKF